jgi:hypothetical protein
MKVKFEIIRIDGNVKVMPPNPSTGMPKYPHKFPKHIPDEYNRK